MLYKAEKKKRILVDNAGTLPLSRPRLGEYVLYALIASNGLLMAFGVYEIAATQVFNSLMVGNSEVISLGNNPPGRIAGLGGTADASARWVTPDKSPCRKGSASHR